MKQSLNTEPLLAAHTPEYLEKQIKTCNRTIYCFLTYFKENKNSRNKADLAMFSYYLKERNRFQRLLKKRLAHDGATK